MSSSSFLYDWESFSNVIKRIYEIINFNESVCYLYTMDYISQSLTHCSKGNIQWVLQCTKFPDKQKNGLIFQTNCSSNKKWYMKLGDGLQRKRGKNKHTCPMFNKYFLASSNQIKLCTTDYIFPIKQDNICNYNPLCFMSIRFMLDDIIMNIFTESTKESTTPHQKNFFFQIPKWYNSL